MKPGQRLVVCSSTWGPGAQLGLLPGLARRLAGELPADEFKVAMIIHPNIWFGHGPWQARVWLRTATEAGVVLVPPRGDEWRAAVLASDVLIADHGSVGFYGMAIGRPLLRASFGEQYLRADAPLAELAQLAPELELADPLAAQLTKRAASSCSATRSATSTSGRSTRSPLDPRAFARPSLRPRPGRPDALRARESLRPCPATRVRRRCDQCPGDRVSRTGVQGARSTHRVF
jgi:hypothetical protein